jgi:outer membrane cobalamin receptor
VDGQEYGPIGTLRNIPASEISTIRLYRSWEATTKFGTGNMGGVIAITTRR